MFGDDVVVYASHEEMIAAGGVDAAIALVDAGPIVTPMDAGGGGGTDAGAPDDTDGGCSVGATRGSSLSALALVAALGLAARRRR